VGPPAAGWVARPGEHVTEWATPSPSPSRAQWMATHSWEAVYAELEERRTRVGTSDHRELGTSRFGHAHHPPEPLRLPPRVRKAALRLRPQRTE